MGLGLQTATSTVLADIGRRGIALRLDAPASRTVDGVHRTVVVTCHALVPVREIAKTLRELAALVEAEA